MKFLATALLISGGSKNFEKGGARTQCISPVVMYRLFTQRIIRYDTIRYDIYIAP